ncbi:hypothetical protein JCM10212_002200, partial [Sporobolomyces blumeae]
MPTTPRAPSTTLSSGQTPRSARRLLTTTTSSPHPRSFSQPSSSLPPAPAPPEFPPLPPLNLKKYPERPYAEDPELHHLLEQDIHHVDESIDLLAARTDDLRRHLRETLAHLESEKVAYEQRIKELGDEAKELVKTQLRERDELDHAKRNEAEVQRQHGKLRVRFEGYQQEVKEARLKLELRRQREGPFRV